LARDDSFLSMDILTNSDIPLNIKILVKQLDGVYDIWRNMDDANRAVVWDHLNLLVQLVDMMDLNRVGCETKLSHCQPELASRVGAAKQVSQPTGFFLFL
jgi:hypothetical protein